MSTPNYQNPPRQVQQPREDPVIMARQIFDEYEFNIIPIERPGGTSHGKNPLRGFKWKEYQYTKIDEDYLYDELFERHTGRNWCNWAVVCGEVSDCVVFDCDDAAAIAWGRKHLPATPFVINTGKGKHFYYRYPTGQTEWLKTLNDLRKKWGVNVDIQRDEKYVIAPGSVHETGKVYSWATDDKWFMGTFPDWQLVPEFQLLNMDDVSVPSASSSDVVQPVADTGTPSAVRPSSGFVSSDLDEPIDVDLSDATPRVDVDEPVEEGGRNNRLTIVIGKFISENPDIDRVKAFDYADEWNKQHCRPPLPYEEVRRTTLSILNAERNKKKAEKARAFFKGEVTQEQATDMSGVEYLDNKELDDSLDIPIPKVLLDPPGVLKMFQQYIMDSSVRTTPVFATAGALTLLAVAAGFKLVSPTDLVTNTYIICVGPSASGKNAPKAAISKLLGKYAPLCLGGDDVSSDAAIVNLLAQDKRHICCFQFDEIGMFLKGCKTPNSSRAGVVKTLTELFSKARSGHTKTYADASANRRIRWHCGCVAGYSVPNEFFSALSGGSDTNGFFGRQIVFIAGDNDRMPKKRKVLRGIPKHIDELMTYLFVRPQILYVDESEKPILDQSLDNLTDPKPLPCEIELEQDAAAYLEERGDYYDNLAQAREQAGDMMASSVYARVEENAWKLIMILHFAQFGWPQWNDKGEYFYQKVSLQTVKWAFEIMEYTSATTIKAATFAIADTEFQDRCNRIQKGIMLCIKTSKRNAANRGCPDKFTPGATLAQIQKFCKQDEPEKVKQALDKLVLMGVLRLDDGSDGGPDAAIRQKKPIYRFVKEKAEA